jgi:hypothetical protein
MLASGLCANSSARAAVCRGMPSCSCYRRVDLRQYPYLCCFCVARSRHARHRADALLRIDGPGSGLEDKLPRLPLASRQSLLVTPLPE